EPSAAAAAKSETKPQMKPKTKPKRTRAVKTPPAAEASPAKAKPAESATPKRKAASRPKASKIPEAKATAGVEPKPAEPILAEEKQNVPPVQEPLQLAKPQSSSSDVSEFSTASVRSERVSTAAPGFVRTEPAPAARQITST